MKHSAPPPLPAHTHTRRNARFLERLLLGGAPVNVRDGTRGETPLLQAIAFGDAHMVSLLVDAGADLEAGAPPDLPHQTALTFAIEQPPAAGNLQEILQILLGAWRTHNTALVGALMLDSNRLHLPDCYDC